MLQRNYHQMLIDWRPLHLFTSELVEGWGSPYHNAPHAHFLTQAEIHRNIRVAQWSHKFDATSNNLLEALRSASVVL